MIYIPNESTDCYFNLALEEYVFSSLDPSQSYLLLWRNHNTIVVGKHQNTVQEINAAYVKENGIHVVRRMSGGGAVYHDLGNLNFTFITHQTPGTEFDFRAFTQPVVRALAVMGVHAEFTGRNDITIQGKKCSGSAQYLRNGRVLHHGTLLFDSNLDVVANALRVRKSKLDSHAVKSTRARVTNIAPYLSSPMTIETFQEILLRQLSTQGISTYHLTADDFQAVHALQKEKYCTWDWNYGVSPPYTMEKELHFPGGLVTVQLSVTSGILRSVRFFGDFFGADRLDLLEQGLAGTPLRKADLRSALEQLHAADYFNHIGTEELLALFFSA